METVTLQGEIDEDLLIGTVSPKAAARALVRFYEGDQHWYMQSFFRTLINDPAIRKQYSALASQWNVTRYVVDQLSVLGSRPVEVSFQAVAGAKATEKAIAEAGEKWGRIAHGEGAAESGDFDSWVAEVGRMAVLTSTVLGAVAWDDAHGRIAFRAYTPNLFDTKRADGNDDATTADIYRILVSDSDENAQATYRVFDFSGPVGETWTVKGDSWERPGASGLESVDLKAEPALLDVKDPKAIRSLVPFAPFRTRLPRGEYCSKDGQIDLIEAQKRVNHGLTQVAIAMHFLGFPVPVFEGPGWDSSDNAPLAISLDPSVGIKPGYDVANPSNAGKVTFLNPGASANIETALNVIERQVAFAVSARGIPPDAVTVKVSAQSGVSLWIQREQLREFHTRIRAAFQAPLEHIVRAAIAYWNARCEKGDEFPANVEPVVTIPEANAALDPESDLAIDEKKKAMGIYSQADLYRKHRPDLSEKDIQERLDEEAQAAGGSEVETPLALAQRIQILVNAGVISKDEARITIDPNLKPLDGGAKATPELQRVVFEVGLIRRDEGRAFYGLPPIGGDEGKEFLYIEKGTPAVPAPAPAAEPPVPKKKKGLFGQRPPEAGAGAAGNTDPATGSKGQA